MEKPKDLHTHTPHGHELRGGLLEGKGYQVDRGKREKTGTIVIA